MLRFTSHPFILILGLVALLLLSCSGSKDGVTNAPAPDGGGNGGGNTVDITGFQFAPGNLTVTAGTMVIWTNKDSSPHSIISNNGGFTSSGNLAFNDTYSFTFAAAGTFPYHCGLHPTMTATIVVTP